MSLSKQSKKDQLQHVYVFFLGGRGCKKVSSKALLKSRSKNKLSGLLLVVM